MASFVPSLKSPLRSDLQMPARNYTPLQNPKVFKKIIAANSYLFRIQQAMQVVKYLYKSIVLFIARKVGPGQGPPEVKPSLNRCP